jgi:thiamine-phosphate pyrophosphorylase
MESLRSDRPGQRNAPRLYLITPPVEDVATFADSMEDAFAAALPAADIAAVLLRLAEADERTLINRVKRLAPIAQERGIALIVDGHSGIVARSGADGAHLTGIASLNAAIGGLQPGRIAGAGGLKSRHDAMLAGEAGADYVMFGEPDAAGRRPSFAAALERIAWWAELFRPPCVGYAGGLDDVAPLAGAGADFVALGDWIWTAEHRAAATIAAAANLLVEAEGVA